MDNDEIVLAKSEIVALSEWLKDHRCSNPPITLWQTGCAIGTNTYARCHICKQEQNITDYTLW